MKIINYKSDELDNSQIILICGFFESIHRGHLSLFKKAINEKKNIPNIKIVVMTFRHNPLNIILKKEIKEIFTYNERKIIYKKLHVDIILLIDFNNKIANNSFQKFNQIVKGHFPNIYKIYCGTDFRYGWKALGTPNDLKYIVDNISIEELLTDNNNIKYSSNSIRNYLNEINIENINTMLFCNYFIYSQVRRGLQNGSKIGFPTANIKINKFKSLPKDGVYFGYVLYMNEKYKAAICISNNPTIDNNLDKTIEVFILDFNLNIYKKFIMITFVSFLRPVYKYKNINLLKEAIENDVIDIRNNY